MIPKRFQEAEHNNISHLAARTGAITISRLTLNTARRFVYPFAPAISRGLGVPLASVTTLIALNQITGILGMLSGPIADRFGYRRMMLAGLAMLAAGLLVGWVFASFLAVGIAVFMAGLGKAIFDPAVQAWVGERIPYRRRGMVIGILELSWAGSSLLGIPLVGYLMEKHGWTSPFLALSILGAAACLALALLIPGKKRSTGATSRGSGFGQSMAAIFRSRIAAGAVLYAFFISFSNDCLFVVYGAWLEDSFQLNLLAIGFGTTIIGVAELLGELTIASAGDRVGLKRSVVIGSVLTMAGFSLLPLLGANLWMCYGGLFLIFFSFELAIVAMLSLCTELVPSARATMMSSFLAAAGLGRVGGALAGGFVWPMAGMGGIGLITTLGCMAAITAILWGLHGWERGARK